MPTKKQSEPPIGENLGKCNKCYGGYDPNCQDCKKCWEKKESERKVLKKHKSLSRRVGWNIFTFRIGFSFLPYYVVRINHKYFLLEFSRAERLLIVSRNYDFIDSAFKNLKNRMQEI